MVENMSFARCSCETCLGWVLNVSFCRVLSFGDLAEEFDGCGLGFKKRG
jgi:hypothetical protein